MAKLVHAHNEPEQGPHPKDHPAITLRVYAHVIRAAADIFAKAVKAA